MPAVEASLVPMRHSTVESVGVKWASPREGRRSVMLRTEGGMGIVMKRSWRVGTVEEEEEEVLLVKKEGVERAAEREKGVGRDVFEEVGGAVNVGEMRRRASKSEPVGPREVVTSRLRGRLSDWGVFAALKGSGRRFTS